MTTHALLVVIETGDNQATVNIYDGTQELDTNNPMAKGNARHWRGALGEALSQIDLPTGKETDETTTK